MKKVRKILLVLVMLTLLGMTSSLFATKSMAEDTLGLNNTSEEKNYDRGSTSTWETVTPTPSAQQSSVTQTTPAPETKTQSIPAAGKGGIIAITALVAIGIAIAVISYKKDRYMNI